MTQRDIHAEMYGRGGGTREQLAVPRRSSGRTTGGRS